MPTLIKLLEIELSSTLTKRYSISGWPVTYDSNVYDNDGTFVGLGDLKFSLELENNPFEVTLHLSDQDVLDSINAYSYRFRDATLIIGEWDGTMIDQSTVVIKKGFVDTHSDPSADFTVDFTISSYLELASKQRSDITASVSHSIKLKDGVYGDDNITIVDTIFDKAGDDWSNITLGRARAGSFTTLIGGGDPGSIADDIFGVDPIYQTTTIPEFSGVKITNKGETFHSPVAYGRTKINFQLVNAWNPTPAAVAVAYPDIVWDEEDFDPLVFDATKYVTMVFTVCHGPVERLEVYNATNDDVVVLLDNGSVSGTGSIKRALTNTTSLAVIDVINNGVNNVALNKSVVSSAGAYTADDRGIGYTVVHVTAIASGFWSSGIPDLTFIAENTHIRALTADGVSPTRTGVNGSGEVMYDYLSSRPYGLGLEDQYIDADSFYDFQANALDIYPDKLRGSITGAGSFIKFLERMQQSVACRIYEESGLVKLWYGDILDNSDIKIEFIDNGLSNTNCVISQQNPRSRSVFNEVTGRYFAIYDAMDEPPDNIQKTVIVSDTDYFVSDNGIKSTTSVDLDFLTLDADADGFVNPADEQQINEIANLILQKSRLFQEVEITTSYDVATGIKLGDLIRCEVSRYGWEVADRRLFFVREIIYTSDGNVLITAQRHSNTVYGGVDSFTNVDVENTFPVRINGLNTIDSYLNTGPQGPQGRFFLQIYIRATTTPTTPTGGTYVNSTNTLTPPTGWFDVIGEVPAGDGNIYFSQATYNPEDDPDSITPSWSVAAQVGTTGADGVDAVTINATSNDYSVIYDSDGANPTPTTVTLTGTAQNVINGFFRFTGGGSDFPDETTFTDGDTALTATRTFTLPTTITESDTRSFNVAVADGDQNELAFDSFTINLIQTAANGSAGANGEDAFTIIMQNEATVLPSNSAGVVSSYDGSENEIEVYRGGTQLTYSGAAGDPSTSQFKISFIDTNITTGAITLSGNNAAIAEASAFTDSADFATINLTIMVRNEADDGNISFVKIQNFTKSKEGGAGTRGSGDWHHRVGTTLAASYTDAELSAFLAATVPGTEGDAPVQGDRLWIFASPSESDQSVTEQQVYIWTGNTWVNQAAAIDGNLLVSGTVTADNVVADISITSPVITGGDITGGTITGGFIEGSFISAGIIRSQIFAFPINQNTDTSIFVDLDEKRRAFLRQDNENPSRNTITQKFSSPQNASSSLLFTASDRFLNVNQDIPLTATGYQEDPDLLRRNWYTHVPYSLTVTYLQAEDVGPFLTLVYSSVFPSCVFSIIDGNDNTVESFTLPRLQVDMDTLDSENPTYTESSPLNGSGRFSDFQMYHSGTLENFLGLIAIPFVIYGARRSNMGINARGFIHLQDDERIEVTIGSTAITGSAYGIGVDGEVYSATLTTSNVGLETDFNSKANYYFDINDSTQTDGADTAPVNLQKDAGTEAIVQNIAIPEQSFINDDFDYDPLESKVSIARVNSELIEGAIDASKTEILNIPPENIVAGDLSGVSSSAGSVRFQPSITLGQDHTLNEIIDAYRSGSSGIGYNLSYNPDTEQPLFAIGDFDDNDPEAWVATNDYSLGDLVTSVSLYYSASEDIAGAAANTAPATDTDRWDRVELPRNSNMFYAPTTGLVIGGTITAGAVRGGNLLSSEIPTGTESGTYIDLDGGTFVFGNAQENLQYDGTNITLSGIPIDGELIINNSIDGNKLNVNTVIARTIRSDNYVAPVLAENPPVMGYSLEHVEGIGFFEEIRADLTGTVTAPSQTPSEGTFLYNTSAVTTEYLNITEGDTLDDFAIDVDGETQVFKGILSEPMWELTLPSNLESNASALFPTNFFAGSKITNGAAYDWYSNLSVNNTTVPFSIVPIWFGYDSNDNIIGEIGYFANLGGPNFVGDNNSVQIPAAERSITSSSAVDSADQIDSLIANAGGVQLGVEIPVTAKLHMIFVSQYTTSSTSLSLRPGDTSPISITGGFRANSSMQFDAKSSDGTSQTTAITQNIP